MARATAREIPRLVHQVLLKCVRCESRLRYEVGTFTLAVDLTEIRKDRKISKVVDRFCGFTGCVHCLRCHSAGPWSYPKETQDLIFELVMRIAAGDAEVPLLHGSTQAFDGTPFQYGGEVENYIKGLLLKRPEDPVLWTRLGSLYLEEWQVKLARQSFEQALRLNQNAIEALYGLGEIQQVLGHGDQASYCYRKILKLARHDREVAAELRRLIVENAVEQILKIDADSGERRLLHDLDAVLPQDEAPDPAAMLYLQDFDPGEPEHWNRLIDNILGTPARG